MTKAEIIIDLKKLIGPGCEIDDGGLGVWVNDSYDQMIGEIIAGNPDYFATSAVASTNSGQQEYSLPSDCEKVLMVNMMLDGVWKRVDSVPNINFIPTVSDTTSSQGFTVSAPVFYVIENNIGFMPIPAETTSQNIRIWYTYTPTELTEDSSVPAIPARYHHILKYAAYANYLDQDDEHAAAERMRVRFDDLVNKMVLNLSERQVDATRSIEITDNSDWYREGTTYI